MLLTVTEAPSIGAPVASSTFPEMDAETCAKAANASNRIKAQAWKLLRKSIGPQDSGIHPARFPEFARRWGEHDLIAALIQWSLRCHGGPRVHQSQVLKNSIYVSIFRLPELVTVRAE